MLERRVGLVRRERICSRASSGPPRTREATADNAYGQLELPIGCPRLACSHPVPRVVLPRNQLSVLAGITPDRQLRFDHARMHAAVDPPATTASRSGASPASLTSSRATSLSSVTPPISDRLVTVLPLPGAAGLWLLGRRGWAIESDPAPQAGPPVSGAGSGSPPALVRRTESEFELHWSARRDDDRSAPAQQRGALRTGRARARCPW